MGERYVREGGYVRDGCRNPLFFCGGIDVASCWRHDARTGAWTDAWRGASLREGCRHSRGQRGAGLRAWKPGLVELRGGRPPALTGIYPANAPGRPGPLTELFRASSLDTSGWRQGKHVIFNRWPRTIVWSSFPEPSQGKHVISNRWSRKIVGCRFPEPRSHQVTSLLHLEY
ncbi:hypothetical protein VUR80DRAFT_77 [Thermomyces stellatus]